jgi:two-component system, LytTR family, sensor kinase
MRWAVRTFLVAVPLLSLLLLGRAAADWWAVANLTGETPTATAPRGFDWVQWEDRDGEIVAAYVYPGGTAYAEGLREGAVLYQLEMQQFFSAEDVKRVVEGMAPGSTLLYDVIETTASGRRTVEYEIPLTRYPTFLYPLSGTLWQASLWGFALAAFLHVLGLLIVAPLARRTRRARRSTLLFVAATAWVVGNLARLLTVTAFGPPMGGVYESAFNALTLVALTGWVLFPALLLYTVISDLPALRRAARRTRFVVFVPPILLGSAIVGAVFWDAVGPLTLDGLIAPILFFVCCYVAAATGLSMLPPRVTGPPDPAADLDVPATTTWSRAGGAPVFALATFGALSVEGVVPLPGTVSDATVGGLIVLIQLLSLAPVGLASLATLRHGRADAVVSGALTVLAALGGAFFVVFGGLLVIERSLGSGASWEHAFAASLYVVLVLLVGERLAYRVRQRGGRWLRTERQRAREALRAFGERLRFLLDGRRLAEETVGAVGEALRAHSAVLFLRDPASPEGAPPRWLRASYRPEPPYFTERELAPVWEHLQHAGTVWARNGELNESALPDADEARLRQSGAVLAVPIAGGSPEPVGLLILGRKARRRAVYNLEDVSLLRALAGQLALAVERLALLEREKALVRRTAEARLTALRAQINPHFLFNALNTIAALIAERPDEAEHAVERLARIFRHVLQTEGQTFVPLRAELRLVDDYLAIEQARFGKKLRVEQDWGEAGLDLPIPAFALQTLVENAVKHGIERRRGGGTLSLTARPAGDVLVITVRDTGAGIPALYAQDLESQGDGAAPHPDFFGIGLRNVADRLAHLYGRHDLLAFSSAPDDGTTAELHIPLGLETP